MFEMLISYLVLQAGTIGDIFTGLGISGLCVAGVVVVIRGVWWALSADNLSRCAIDDDKLRHHRLVAISKRSITKAVIGAIVAVGVLILGSLTPDSKEAFLLLKMQQMQPQEAMAVLEAQAVPGRNVEQELARANNRVRELLREKEQDERDNEELHSVPAMPEKGTATCDGSSSRQ